MATPKKADIRVIFDTNISDLLRKDVEKEHRTLIEQVQYIVSCYYENKKRSKQQKEDQE